MKWICLIADKQLDIKESSLSYPAKSRLSPVKLGNELEIEQIKWKTLADGRQIIWLYGQGSEPWTQILCNYNNCSSGQSRTFNPKIFNIWRGWGLGWGCIGITSIHLRSSHIVMSFASLKDPLPFPLQKVLTFCLGWTNLLYLHAPALNFGRM